MQSNEDDFYIPDITAMVYTTVPFDAGPDEPVSECFFYPGSKEVLMNLAGFPRPLEHPATPTFRLDTVSGKGMGVFSTRALKFGDRILCERPLLITAPTVPLMIQTADLDNPENNHMDWRRNEMEKHYKVSVNRMRPDDKAAFMALANTRRKDGSTTPIHDIIDTNAFGVHGLLPGHDLMGRETYPAVCKDLSRLNHR
jgi:hypothetical protein